MLHKQKRSTQCKIIKSNITIRKTKVNIGILKIKQQQTLLKNIIFFFELPESLLAIHVNVRQNKNERP